MSVVVVSGPSGVGKGTVMAEWRRRDPRVKVVVSATTRARAEGEIEGVHYRFVEVPTFREMIERGEFLEWANVFGDTYYGTPATSARAIEDAGDIAVLEIDVQGAFQVREKRPDARLIFILPPSYEELERRLIDRGREPMDKIQRRLAQASREMAEAGRYDLVLTNHTGQVDVVVDAIQAFLADG